VIVSVANEPKAADSELVLAARDGDRAAFGSLYGRYRSMVHGILLSHVSFSDAEDLMQDVFVQALGRLPYLREVAAFGGWLAAIARNRAVDYQRGRKNLVEIDERNVGSISQSEGRVALDAIRRLPEAYREPLILRLVEGMTGPEIAVRTGLTADSVRVNLCRGMKLLRAQLEGETRR
jgi:RNA polymerase sigma-70 factor (ECF subfamily)